MKRSDRVMAVLLALQTGPVTAQELADKFEVSRRSILRDMEALAEMGIPLYAVSGPGGGFRLVEGFALPPLRFDSREALAVLFALSAIERLADTPFREARWTAIAKLRAALPKTALEQAASSLARVELQVPQRKVRTPHLDELLRLASEGAWLRVLYRSERSRRELVLRPHKIYAAHGFWYCRACSAEHGEERTFRVDRFERIEALPDAEAIPQPDERPSSRGGEAEDARKDAASAAAATRIVARLTYRGALLAEQDEHIGELVKMIGDGEWQVAFDCPAEELEWAIRFFYSLGPDAEVTEPEALRTELRRRAEAMARRYAPNEQSNVPSIEQ